MFWRLLGVAEMLWEVAKVLLRCSEWLLEVAKMFWEVTNMFLVVARRLLRCCGGC